MIYYILIFLSAIGCAVTFIFNKVYQLEQGNTIKSGIIFNCLVGFAGSVIYFVVCGFKIEITIYSVIMAVLFTIFLGLYTIIGFKIMSMGSMAVYTIFLMLGGMIVPYFYGIIFLNEEITVIKIIALIMMTVAIILQNGTKEKKGSKFFYLLCCMVFVLNGMTSIVSKSHQISTQYSTVSANEFVFLKNIMRFLLFGAMLPFIKCKNIFNMSAKSNFAIIGAALVSSMAYMMQLICASHLPATVQFPALSGGTIIFTALFSFFFL